MIALAPKSTFLADKKTAGQWQDVVATPLFTKAIEAALLSYATGLGGTGMDGPTLAIVGMKLEGAKGLIKELMVIGKLTASGNSPQTESLEPT